MEGLQETEYPRSLKELLVQLPARAVALVWKVVSIQGLVLGIATYLVFQGKIESYAWLVCCCLVLFGRYALDVLKEIRK